MIQTIITDNSGKKETFASENKFEAIVIGMRAAFRLLKGSKDLELWMDKSPQIFNLLWNQKFVSFANLISIELNA